MEYTSSTFILSYSAYLTGLDAVCTEYVIFVLIHIKKSLCNLWMVDFDSYVKLIIYFTVWILLACLFLVYKSSFLYFEWIFGYDVISFCSYETHSFVHIYIYVQ
jgi:hypothetical protein